MTDEPKSNNGNNVPKPNVPDQTRGQNPTSPPQKPAVPSPTVKTKK